MNPRDSMDPLDGFRGVSHRDKEVHLENPETIYDLIAIEVKETLRQKSATEELKRKVAKYTIFVTLSALVVFLGIGTLTDDYKAAQLWWYCVGPIDGYMLRSVFGGRGP